MAFAKLLDEWCERGIGDLDEIFGTRLVGRQLRDMRVEVRAGDVQRQHVGHPARPIELLDDRADRALVECLVDVARSLTDEPLELGFDEPLERFDEHRALGQQQSIGASVEMIHSDPDERRRIVGVDALVDARHSHLLVEVPVGVDRQRGLGIAERHRRRADEVARLPHEVLVAGDAALGRAVSRLDAHPRGNRRRRQVREERVVEVGVGEPIAPEQGREIRQLAAAQEVVEKIARDAVERDEQELGRHR
jgi:hypothetical protein